jgi:hypothetical protein
MYNKEKHTSCKNCKLKTSIIFKNKVIFCFGLIKKIYSLKDYYRFCIIKNKNRSCTDIMLEEIYTLLNGLSTLLIQKRFEEINKKYGKKHKKR